MKGAYLKIGSIFTHSVRSKIPTNGLPINPYQNFKKNQALKSIMAAKWRQNGQKNTFFAFSAEYLQLLYPLSD